MKQVFLGSRFKRKKREMRSGNVLCSHEKKAAKHGGLIDTILTSSAFKSEVRVSYSTAVRCRCSAVATKDRVRILIRVLLKILSAPEYARFSDDNDCDCYYRCFFLLLRRYFLREKFSTIRREYLNSNKLNLAQLQVV